MAQFRWLLLAVLIARITFAENTTLCPLAVGDRFSATDTLACGDEHDPDAKQCLAGLAWAPTKFEVVLEPAQAGCGDFLVRFPSARPIGDPLNDTVAMEWFAPHGDDDKIRSARAIVVVHESASHMTVGRLIARGISGQGLHAFLIQLPGYGARRSPSPPKAEQILPSLLQAVADVRRARDAVAALPLIDHSLIGVEGTSLGGFVTATVAGLDHGYDRIFIALAGGDIQDVILNGARDAAKAHAKLNAAGVSDDQIKAVSHEIEPLRLARRIEPEKTWLYNGKLDTVVSPRNSLALATAAHLAEEHHIEFPTDHYGGIVYLPQVIDQIMQRMAESPSK